MSSLRVAEPVVCLVRLCVCGMQNSSANVPVGHELDEDRLTSLHDDFSCPLRREVTGKQIVTVDTDGVHTVRNTTDRNTITCVLILHGGADSVAEEVTKHKDQLHSSL